MDYTQLRTELQTDPQGLGYAAHITSGADTELAKLLNTSRAGIAIDRGVIPSYEVINATAPADWAALTSAEKQRYQTLTGAGQIDTQNANVRATFLAMFAAGTTTRTALAAPQSRQGSRAEQLFGARVVVTHEDVAKALRG